MSEYTAGSGGASVGVPAAIGVVSASLAIGIVAFFLLTWRSLGRGRGRGRGRGAA